MDGPGPPNDPWWVRDNLREAIDHLVEQGYTVSGGHGEDPELLDPGGSGDFGSAKFHPWQSTTVTGKPSAVA